MLYEAEAAIEPPFRMRPLQAMAIAIVGSSISGAILAAGPGEPRSRGPDGFGNIPYGSSSDEAIKLNHGNGAVTVKDGSRVLTYRTRIQGLTFDVAQNYDKERRAVDAIAISTSMASVRDCVARFNHILGLLETSYGQSGSPPLQSRTAQGGTKYTVLFAFSRSDGIEAELTTGDASRSIPGTRPVGQRSNNSSEPCIIRLHYLPPGWVGRL